MPTLIPGKRIKPGTILLTHLGDFKIPESRLLLNFPSHIHANQAILNRIRYAGASEMIDLSIFEGAMLEIVAARRNGLTLGGTIDSKADKSEVKRVADEILEAKGDHATLYDAVHVVAVEVEGKLEAHKGNTPHSALDALHADYNAAKNGHSTMLEMIQSLTPVDPTGDIVINQLRPWHFSVTVSDSSVREFTIPQTFATNCNSLEVFEGPLRMMVDVDYIEKDTHTIEFLYNLPMGAVLRFTGLEKGALYEWAQHFTATAGQRTFTLVNPYELGRDQVAVYESGMLMRKGVDYTESNPNAISFVDSLPTGTLVSILKRR